MVTSQNILLKSSFCGLNLIEIQNILYEDISYFMEFFVHYS